MYGDDMHAFPIQTTTENTKCKLKKHCICISKRELIKRKKENYRDVCVSEIENVCVSEIENVCISEIENYWKENIKLLRYRCFQYREQLKIKTDKKNTKRTCISNIENNWKKKITT